MVATTAGTIGRFRLQIPAEEVDLTLRDLPVPQLAVIGRAPDGPAASKWVQAVWAEFVRGVFATVGAKPPSAKKLKLVGKEDLGLGLPTFVFSGAWLGRLPKEYRATVETEGDFRPHYFHHDGHLVLSTSLQLSQRILQAARNADTRWLPWPPESASAVGIGWLSGETLAQAFCHVFDWIEAIVKEHGEELPTRDGREFGRELCRLLQRVEWNATQDNATRSSEWKVKFRDP